MALGRRQSTGRQARGLQYHGRRLMAGPGAGGQPGHGGGDRLGASVRAPAESPVVATLGRVNGAVESGAGTDWLPVNAGQTLAAGREIVDRSRWPGRCSTCSTASRSGSTPTPGSRSPASIASSSGAVASTWTRAPTRAPAMPCGSSTPFGTTRHLGTQYEVRVAPEQMQVAIREGRVEVTGTPSATSAVPAPVVAVAGEKLVLKTTGDLSRGTIPRRDPRWNWIGDVTPPFAIEQRRLTDFLAWVCRETGRDLRFASPQVEAAAGQVVLRGSVAGLVTGRGAGGGDGHDQFRVLGRGRRTDDRAAPAGGRPALAAAGIVSPACGLRSPVPGGVAPSSPWSSSTSWPVPSRRRRPPTPGGPSGTSSPNCSPRASHLSITTSWSDPA